MKRRQSKNLPPKKLYDLLAKIYPKAVAQVTYLELMGKQPPGVRGRREWAWRVGATEGGINAVSD